MSQIPGSKGAFWNFWQLPEVPWHCKKNLTSITPGTIDKQCREFKGKLTV